jgi:NHL repeat
VSFWLTAPYIVAESVRNLTDERHAQTLSFPRSLRSRSRREADSGTFARRLLHEGVAVDGQGSVYVADRGNNRTVKLAA